MEKYKHLILSQVFCVLGVASAVLAYFRLEQSQDPAEPMTLGFILFAVLFFVVELRLIFTWLANNKKI
jgi:hypothetical protein